MSHAETVRQLLQEADRAAAHGPEAVADRMLLFPRMRAALHECARRDVNLAGASDKLHSATRSLRATVIDLRAAGDAYRRNEPLPIGKEYTAFCATLREVFAALEEIAT